MASEIGQIDGLSYHDSPSRLCTTAEESMPRNGNLPERVATLEAWVKIGWTVATVVLFAWLSWLSVVVYGLSGDVKAIRQAEKDRGHEIIAQIAHPTSPQQQRLALITATSNVEKALVEKQPPQRVKIEALSEAVLTSLRQPHPSLEAWQATSAVITYKTSAQAEFKSYSDASCLLPKVKLVLPMTGDPGHFKVDARDCTLDLNDLAVFEASGFNQVSRSAYPGGRRFLYINLIGGVVKYDPSRPVIPIEHLSCVLCRVEISTEQIPPLRQQNLLKTLLATDNPTLFISGESLGAPGEG